MISDFVPVFLILGIAGVLAALAWYASRTSAKRLGLSDRARASLSYIVLGPVLAAILGGGAVAIATYLADNRLVTLPTILLPGNLLVFVELIVLAAGLRTAGAIAKRYVPSVANVKEADRLLIYGVYALGLIALAYILLTSPISPVISASVWATINFAAGLTMTYLVAYVVYVVLKR